MKRVNPDRLGILPGRFALEHTVIIVPRLDFATWNLIVELAI
jgi:hypothetical protein